MAASTPRAASWNRRTVNSSSGSTRSSRWTGTSARCARVGLAVPMSMPRYTAMESTDTSSASGRRRATSRASAVLPDAVGPTRATCRRAPGRAVGARTGLPGRDGDADAPPGRRLDTDQVAAQVMGGRLAHEHFGVGAHGRGAGARGSEVDELVLTRAARDDPGIALARPFDEHL